MNSPSPSQVLDALRPIIDPDFRKSIVEDDDSPNFRGGRSGSLRSRTGGVSSRAINMTSVSTDNLQMEPDDETKPLWTPRAQAKAAMPVVAENASM